MQAEPSNKTVKLKCNLKQIINNISILVGFELQLYEQFDAIYSPACMAGCDLKFVVA